MILTNAMLVLPDEVVHGTVHLEDGLIRDIQPGPARSPGAQDLEGDFLLPGIVDLHTDNLERQVQPRANARWPSRSAFLAHDAQCAVVGVTTVLDALCLGDLGFDQGRDQTFQDGVADLTHWAATGLLRAEHLLHLRCELPARDMPALLDGVAEHPLVAMVSLMDHSPGVGQYRDIERYKAMRIKQTKMTPAEVDQRIAELQANRERTLEGARRWVLDRLADRGIPLASHDDESAAQVRRNAADGIRISEFPVTMEAAEAARDIGVGVIAGAPNVVRGGSHSGNVAAMDLARAKAVDALASDYVPPALVEAAFILADEIGLPAAVRTVTEAPARMAALHDRGALRPGLRADLVRVRRHEGMPVVRATWLRGARVA